MSCGDGLHYRLTESSVADTFTKRSLLAKLPSAQSGHFQRGHAPVPAHKWQHEAKRALVQQAEHVHKQVDRQRVDDRVSRRWLARELAQVRPLARAPRAPRAGQLTAAAQAEVAPPALADVCICVCAARRQLGAKVP